MRRFEAAAFCPEAAAHGFMRRHRLP